MNPLKYFLLVGGIFGQVSAKQIFQSNYDKDLAKDLLLEHGLSVYADEIPPMLDVYGSDVDELFDENGCIDLGYNIVIQRICPCCVKNHFGLPIPTAKPKKKRSKKKKSSTGCSP